MIQPRTLAFLIVTLAWSFWGLGANAQQVPPPEFNSTDPLWSEVEVKVSYAPNSNVKVGDIVTLTFDVHLLVDGWHLYSSKRAGNISYNPTELFLFDKESKGGMLCGGMGENKKPREYEDELLGGLVRDFLEHEVKFTQRVKIEREQVDLVGEFALQYCLENGMCKFVKAPFEWHFKALPGPQRDCSGKEIGAAIAAQESLEVNIDPVGVDSESIPVVDSHKVEVSESLPPVKGPGGAAFMEKDAQDCSPGNLLGMFALAFILGLGAILTPCVFPMIPLTVSFFLKQGEGHTDRMAGVRNGGLYAASIVFIYAGLGLIISVLFGPSALYTLGSHPIPNIIFFLIFIVFALSFFGMFEITLPSSWSTAMNTRAGRGGFLGPFFMALTLVLVSFSCTGPLLGAAVVGATQGDVCTWKPFMAFLGFGVAFGIPFGFLAAFPKLLEKLPMAGGWMNTVKAVFGFLELALCMKFLSNADLAMHWHLLDRQVFIGIWIVIFGLMGTYFLGWITLPHDDKLERISVPRLLFAVASMSFSLYLVPGLWGAPLGKLEGLVPPTHIDMGVRLLPHQTVDMGQSFNSQICHEDRVNAELFVDRETHGLCAFYDLDQAIQFAKEKNKPLFVDFTGHSCANCRRMEQDVWPKDKIHKLLTEEFVLVSLYADEEYRFETPKLSPSGKKLRSIGSWVQDYQARNYGLIAQPYYVIMDHDQQALNKPVGFTPNVETYEAFLKEGIAAFNLKHGIVAP